MRAVRRGGWALALPLIVLGGIYSGTFTPTEAGAVALVYSVAVTVWVHKDLTLPQIGPIFAEAATLIGSIVLIVVLAFGLNDFLALIDAAGQLGAWLEGADLSPFTFLLIVNALLIVIGALMDSISATLVFAPLLAPIAFNVYGIDPIHFAIIFVVNMEIGYLAPPVATNLFVAAAIFRRPFEQVVRAIFPTLGLVCVALLIVMVVPTLSKGVLNTRAGIAFYQPFPWAGPPDQASTGEVAPPSGTGTATPATEDFCARKPDRMTLQEMSEYARRCAPTTGTPAAP
jgi:C4-dicarboxylate transporter DctM subunit